jgi:cysteine synthase
MGDFKIIDTDLIDVSFLLDNPTSTLLLKLEQNQITHSHKLRLAVSMVEGNIVPFSMFEGFAEASSGNTGLALAEISDILNKPLETFRSRYYFRI